MVNLLKEIVIFAQKLNITNLSPLRSGNISVRANNKGIEGFYITPSGVKYETLKENDIVFVNKNGDYA